MTGCIALLRGINVGGARKVRMTALVEVLEQTGLQSVRTYLQSGNAVFETGEVDLSSLESRIRAALTHHFSLDIDVLVFSAAEWQAVAHGNPFLAERPADQDFLYVTLLAREPDAGRLANLKSPVGIEDEFRATGRAIYLYCPGGYGRTKLNNTYFERKLGLPATTRNWRTVQALLALVNG